jgi:hypothetical protein
LRLLVFRLLVFFLKSSLSCGVTTAKCCLYLSVCIIDLFVPCQARDKSKAQFNYLVQSITIGPHNHCCCFILCQRSSTSHYDEPSTPDRSLISAYAHTLGFSIRKVILATAPASRWLRCCVVVVFVVENWSGNDATQTPGKLVKKSLAWLADDDSTVTSFSPFRFETLDSL